MNTALLATLLLAPAAEIYSDYQSPAELPLEITWLEPTDHGGVLVRPLRYTSRRDGGGQPIRVYALYAAPPGPGPHPTILHVHGGGQTASATDVLDMVERGYACLSFDWTGVTDTRGPEIVTVFARGPQDLRRVEPTPRQSHVVEVIIAARRGIDVLEAQPEVDRTRIGTYGISWGGFANFLLGAVEPRLRCSVPVYCCGWLPRGQEQIDADDAWHRWFEPYSYMPYQRAPMLYLSGTNDFSGTPDKLAELWARLNQPGWISYTRDTNHHLAAPQALAAYRFLDWHLRGGPAFPVAPELGLAIVDGRLRGEVAAPGALSARIWYSQGERPSTVRFWHDEPARAAADGRFVADDLPLGSLDGPLWIIAHASYPDGLELSSVPRITTPGELGVTVTGLAADRPLYDPARGTEGWTETQFTGGTQLYSHQVLEVVWEPTAGPGGGPCVTLRHPRPPGSWAIGFRGPAEATRSGAGATGLRVELAGGSPQMRILAWETWPFGQPWTAGIEHDPAVWQTVDVGRERFVDAAGQPLDDLGRIHYLEFAGGAPTGPPRFAGLAWLR